MQTIKLTINRWHKLRGRLMALMDIDKTELQALQGQVIDNPLGTDDQIEALQQSADAAWISLEEFCRRSLLLSEIKSQVASAASSVKVSAKLALLDGVQSQLQVLEHLLQGQPNPSAVSLNDLRQFFSGNREKPEAARRTVLVRALTDARKAHLQEQVNILRREAFALQEDIAELNQSIVPIELDDWDASQIRDLLGLS